MAEMGRDSHKVLLVHMVLFNFDHIHLLYLSKREKYLRSNCFIPCKTEIELARLGSTC